MIPPELAAIPPILRRTRTPARKRLAWIGFTLAYIVLPLALIAGIYALNAYATAYADRAHAFYQQTQANH